MRTLATFAAIASLLATHTACKKPAPPADPEFSDALTFTFRAFNGPATDLAYALRNLETQTYLDMDLTSSSNLDRSLTPEHLTVEDVIGLQRPDRNLADAIPVCVGTLSSHPIDEQREIVMLTDQTPVEPYSPNHYIRTFLTDKDCWYDKTCEYLETHNDLVKDNFLLTIPYEFLKDYRWIDMNLPGTGTLEEGEEPPTVSDDPRWAYVGRSWTTESASGESGKNWLHQSYTIEIWVPRDGRGFLRDSGGTDSSGGGTLRLLSLWSETELGGINVSDDTIAGTTRVGIDDNFDAQEDWLDENFP